VKIKVVHQVCGREILAQQILESRGHCPWDGKAFNADYTALIAEALEVAEAAGSTLENALEKLAAYKPDFVIEESTVLEPLSAQLELLNERKARISR
jgi:hypothetical protein